MFHFFLSISLLILHFFPLSYVHLPLSFSFFSLSFPFLFLQTSSIFCFFDLIIRCCVFSFFQLSSLFFLCFSPSLYQSRFPILSSQLVFSSSFFSISLSLIFFSIPFFHYFHIIQLVSLSCPCLLFSSSSLSHSFFMFFHVF